jgi:hypothetical protein
MATVLVFASEKHAAEVARWKRTVTATDEEVEALDAAILGALFVEVDPVNRGPEPYSRMPWNRTVFEGTICGPLDEPVPTRETVLGFRADLDAIVHRMNGWEAKCTEADVANARATAAEAREAEAVDALRRVRNWNHHVYGLICGPSLMRRVAELEPAEEGATNGTA